MRLFTSNTLHFVFGALCLLSSSHVKATTTPKCNADNCLRAMYPTNSPAQLSTAAAFCSTYTKSVNTATTGFPTRAAAACGYSPSRFSSVCLCQPKTSTTTTSSTTSTPSTTAPTTTTPTTTTSTTTQTPTCADTGLLKNGGFECGIAPWQPAATPGTLYLINSPGHSGQFAFEVDQVAPADTSTGREQASVNQDITTTVGKGYILTFWSFFNRGDAGFIGVKIDNSPVYTVDASDFNGPLVWNFNSISFVAAHSVTNIRIEFLISPVGTVAKVDDVAVVAS